MASSRAVSFVTKKSDNTAAATTKINDGTKSSRDIPPAAPSSSSSRALDFIGPVKDLFAMPYSSDRGISVAVHNIGGTLLVDADTSAADFGPSGFQNNNPRLSSNRRRPRPTGFFNIPVDSAERQQRQQQQQHHQQQGVVPEEARSCKQQSQTSRTGTELVALQQEEKPKDALALVTSMLQHQSMAPTAVTDSTIPTKDKRNNISNNRNISLEPNEDNGKMMLPLPPPENYAGPVVPEEPREYLSWKFQDMNLLVGSDAAVYRNSSGEGGSSASSADENNDQAIAVRIADVNDLRSQLHQHQEMVRQGTFVPDHEMALHQQMGKQRSYAEALTPQPERLTMDEEKGTTSLPQHESMPVKTQNGAPPSFSAPDLEQVRLQTCMIPSASTALGGLLSPIGPQQLQSSVNQSSTSESTTTTPSPISTVMDAYLDNIMANVPQLALCLHEKGLIQSVKLMQTEDIPYALMHPSTLDTTSSFAMNEKTAAGEPLFTPQIMEMNASMILRFLKANCTRDNSTYLLRREAGQTNIQLYDVSSISSQRQRKWIWWLATMSYRFALRLGQLSLSHHADYATQREFRSRQRSLLQNALDMLEDLKDMDGGAHETLRSAVSESLADTFLCKRNKNGSSMADGDVEGKSFGVVDEDTSNKPAPTTSKSQPYNGIPVDALNKAHDHLCYGIRTLWPVLERANEKERQANVRRKKHRIGKKKTSLDHRQRVVVQNDESSSSSSSDSDQDDDDNSCEDAPMIEIEAITIQLFGLHHKIINASLRLAEYHLHNYYSSSAMQSLRTAARRMAAAISLLQPLGGHGGVEILKGGDIKRLIQSLRHQYTWLWEHCGHFARSFAADGLWRDRGHACGDDIISLLQDVEAAFVASSHNVETPIFHEDSQLTKKSENSVSLKLLSAVVVVDGNATGAAGIKTNAKHVATTSAVGPEAVAAIRAKLENQKQIKRDERRVLVAACVSYSRSVDTFQEIIFEKAEEQQQKSENEYSQSKGSCSSTRIPEPLQEPAMQVSPADSAMLALLQQRLGDACNEIGKIFLNELRTLLADAPSDETKNGDSSPLAAGPLLSSAQFWFSQGLRNFEECKDLRNVALIQCNLCQCCKLQANNMFGPNDSSQESANDHAEHCLQDAANHLQMAHATLGERDVDPVTWDMVSEELAATYLVLGVRRRQSLLGSGSTPLILQALRLTPGKERSIIEPMERALKIYEQSGNAHQAAAAHYQLALFFSKVWTCQRDESKTREKLSDAFLHYSSAHKYFSQSPPGNEATFVILCLDLSNLYSAVVAGDKQEECVAKALHRCLEAADAFSFEAIDAAHERNSIAHSDWFEKMSTLASSVEDRVFKLLMSLVKLEKENLLSSRGKYKELYRNALTVKMSTKIRDEKEGTSPESILYYVHELLTTIKQLS